MISFFILFLIFFPIVMGIVGYFVSKKWEKVREIYFISINLIEMIMLVILAFTYKNFGADSFTLAHVLGLGLSFKADTFRVIYAGVSIFLWLMTVTFSKEYMKHYASKERYYLFYLITLGGVVGVFFSNDFYTTFCFFELMSFASYPLVIHEETKDAMKAGEAYLGIAVISGMMLLVGLFFIYFQTGTLSFEALRTYYSGNKLTTLSYVGGILILLGFGAKAGMYPLHIWLPKAHPVAPAPASALLSGILTKTGVFGIIALAANVFMADYSFGIILLVLALITMFLGAFLALFSVNIKRTLACSSMSQIGFILVGIAFMVLLKEEGGIAQCGALLHMVNHSFIKLVLFMAAGVIAMNIHSLDLNDIRGFGRKKPFLMIMFAIGSLGIMGIPFFNGYVSKTMIHESILAYINANALTGGALIGFKIVEWIFLISGGLTIAYMSKLFACVFIEKNIDEEKQKQYDGMKNYLSPLSKVVFILSVIAIPCIGILPNVVTENIIAKANVFFGVEELSEKISFFSFESLKGALISILIGAVVYFVIVRFLLLKKGKYINAWPRYIDMEDYFYRPLVVDASFYFIIYFVRYIALGLDYLIYFLSKTIFRSHTYRFKEKSFSKVIGERIDERKETEDHYYEEAVSSFNKTISYVAEEETSTYSFAFSMIALGIIIVLVSAVLISL